MLIPIHFNARIWKVLSWSILMLYCMSPVRAQTVAEEFKPSGKIWGYAFGDFFVKTGGDTATWASRLIYSGVPKKVYAFSLRRLYLGYDYTISPTFSTSVILEGSDAVLTAKGERSVFIKALFLKWKNIYRGGDLLIGQMPTLSYSTFFEKLWGYRSIERTMLDQRAIRPSSDMGVALYGSFDSLRTFGYDIMISNGTGVKPEELTQLGKHKVYAGDIFGYFFDRQIMIDLYADYQTGPNDQFVSSLHGFVVYQTEPVTFGIEVFSGLQNNVKSDGSAVKPFGVSLFTRGRIIKDKLNAFARYDSYNPDIRYRDIDAITIYNAASMNNHYDEQFITAGLDFIPHKNVHLLPNIWINSYKAKADNAVLVHRKADIVPRITFYFIFK
ncbi:MAG: hypothetical protein ABIQ02_13235 [Saprospiraceae bacterium]